MDYEEKEPGGKVLAAVVDPVGRIVYVTARVWRHITRQHGEVRDQLNLVTRTIERAEVRCATIPPDREILYAKGIGPSNWFSVVVAFKGTVGLVITAHATRRGPKWERRIG